MLLSKELFSILTLILTCFQANCALHFNHPRDNQNSLHSRDIKPFDVHHHAFSPRTSEKHAPKPHIHGPLIQTKWGLIKGINQEVLGRNIKSFLGIPYAEPPLDKLRFSKPVPLNGSNHGIYEATEFRSACMQRNGDEKVENLGGVGFSEDCLHLNIWVPDKFHHSESAFPVVFYVYSSAFHKSSPAKPSNRGDILAAMGNVIVVAPNYRLGFFGFAFGDNDEMPGNMALWDTLLALEWTRDNIHHFGGDPALITLAGSSAGAMFSSMLTLSPIVAPFFFDHVFLMSGVAANGLYIESKNISLAKTRYIAKQVNCSDDETSTLALTSDEIDCLRNTNATDLLETQEDDSVKQLGNSVLNAMMPIFGDDFMPEAPEVLLAKGHYRDHMSFVIGNEMEEDGISTEFWPENKTDAYQYLEEKFKKMIENFEDIEDEFNRTVQDYFDVDHEDGRKSIKQALVSIFSDYAFNCPCLYFAEKWAQKANIVHLYVNEYVASAFTSPGNMSQRPFGPMHGDDTLLMLGEPFRETVVYSHLDKTVSAQLIQLLTNYIKGARLPWPPVLTYETHVKPLRWRITEHVDFKLIDVDPKTNVCKIWNRFRNMNSL